MVETNNQGVAPEVKWPREIEPDQLQSLLEENRDRQVNLRNVVARQLRRESDYLSNTFGLSVSINGFINLTTELNNSLEFVDSGRDTDVEEITNRLFGQEVDLSTLERLGLLTEAIKQYEQVVPSIEVDKASDFTEHLVETKQRVEILRKEPTGIELVDYLGEQNSYQPDVDPGNFEQENLGGGKAAELYKELYNLLLANGATPD